jgi:hypothetical protein
LSKTTLGKAPTQIIQIFLAKRLTTSSDLLDNQSMPTKLFLASRRKAKGNKMTNATQTSRNESMYGFNDIEGYIDQVKESITYKLHGGHFVVAGLMSDAQEQMGYGNTEGARQTLNIAKTILFQIMDGDLIGTRSTRS